VLPDGWVTDQCSVCQWNTLINPEFNCLQHKGGWLLKPVVHLNGGHKAMLPATKRDWVLHCSSTNIHCWHRQHVPLIWQAHHWTCNRGGPQLILTATVWALCTSKVQGGRLNQTKWGTSVHISRNTTSAASHTCWAQHNTKPLQGRLASPSPRVPSHTHVACWSLQPWHTCAQAAMAVLGFQKSRVLLITLERVSLSRVGSATGCVECVG